MSRPVTGALALALALATAPRAAPDAALSTGAPAGRVGAIMSALPSSPDPDARYLFYLHGAIVEDEGPEAVHPVFGPYRYVAILDSLAAAGLTVLSEVRPAGTDGRAYARKITAEVDTLLAAGVPPSHITVAGFSKGGGIAISVSSLLANDRVNFVFMAACPRAMRDWPDLQLSGRILSIYEESDDFAGSCGDAFAASSLPFTHKEIEIALGGAHGAFYRPHAEWIRPVVEWAESAPEPSGVGLPRKSEPHAP
jgi:pimeloyl-ACP methyl ester carboxylesterase